MACKLSPAPAFRLLLAVSLLVLCALSGCNRTPEIKSYPAPKDSDAPSAGAEQPSVGQVDPADRMLAALVPHGERAWSFKLVGPQADVNQYADAFRTLVQSVKFADGNQAEPEWTLPEGWEQKAGNSELRLATITPPDAPSGLEVSVGPVLWRPRSPVMMLLTNINRWRKQMQLVPVRIDELADDFETLQAPAGEAMLVDLKGKLNPDAMKPPLAAAGTGDVPAGHPPVETVAENKKESPKPGGATIEGKREPEPPYPGTLTPALSQKEREKASPAVSQKERETDVNLPFTFSVPDDWKTKANPAFAVAAFTTKDNAAAVDVSITPMMGPGGDVLMNVNRWRAQLRLPQIQADDLSSAVKKIEIGGQPGQVARLVAAEDAKDRQAITAAVIKSGDTTWIFRMKGDAAAVEKQQANFEKFLGSIKFRGSEK